MECRRYESKLATCTYTYRLRLRYVVRLGVTKSVRRRINEGQDEWLKSRKIRAVFSFFGLSLSSIPTP
jgi:hypothetical protein